MPFRFLLVEVVNCFQELYLNSKNQPVELSVSDSRDYFRSDKSL